MRLVLLNAALLILLAGIIGAEQLLDGAPPRIQATVERYARAMEAQDLQAALAEIEPSDRPRWTAWVESQLGNIYEVKSVAVREPSGLDRILAGASGTPTEASVAMDVNRGYPDFFFQPTTRVGVVQTDGRWYLAEPLLARELPS